MKWEQEHPERRAEIVAHYRADSPHYKRWIRAYRRTPLYCLVSRFRARIYEAIKRADAAKKDSSVKLLGCTARQFKCHIESLFLPGMAWTNRRKWHIDHIKPICRFDLTTEKGQRAAFHYTNCQPLWARANLRKGRKYGNT